MASHQGFFLWDWLYRFKAHALDVLLSLLPEPQASLLAGILLGVETGIPADLDEAFVATGTSHIVAISGFNLTIIAGVFIQIADRALKGPRQNDLPAGRTVALHAAGGRFSGGRARRRDGLPSSSSPAAKNVAPTRRRRWRPPCSLCCC